MLAADPLLLFAALLPLGVLLLDSFWNPRIDTGLQKTLPTRSGAAASAAEAAAKKSRKRKGSTKAEAKESKGSRLWIVRSIRGCVSWVGRSLSAVLHSPAVCGAARWTSRVVALLTAVSLPIAMLARGPEFSAAVGVCVLCLLPAVSLGGYRQSGDVMPGFRGGVLTMVVAYTLVSLRVVAGSYPPAVYVDASGGVFGSHATLQEALGAAQPGATLFLLPGTYDGPVVVNKAVTIAGWAAEEGRVVVKGGGTVLTAGSSVELRDLTILQTPGNGDAAAVVIGEAVPPSSFIRVRVRTWENATQPLVHVQSDIPLVPEPVLGDLVLQCGNEEVAAGVAEWEGSFAVGCDGVRRAVGVQGALRDRLIAARMPGETVVLTVSAALSQLLRQLGGSASLLAHLAVWMGEWKDVVVPYIQAVWRECYPAVSGFIAVVGETSKDVGGASYQALGSFLCGLSEVGCSEAQVACYSEHENATTVEHCVAERAEVPAALAAGQELSRVLDISAGYLRWFWSHGGSVVWNYTFGFATGSWSWIVWGVTGMRTIGRGVFRGVSDVVFADSPWHPLSLFRSLKNFISGKWTAFGECVRGAWRTCLTWILMKLWGLVVRYFRSAQLLQCLWHVLSFVATAWFLAGKPDVKTTFGDKWSVMRFVGMHSPTLIPVATHYAVGFFAVLCSWLVLPLVLPYVHTYVTMLVVHVGLPAQGAHTLLSRRWPGEADNEGQKERAGNWRWLAMLFAPRVAAGLLPAQSLAAFVGSVVWFWNKHRPPPPPESTSAPASAPTSAPSSRPESAASEGIEEE
eukprot:Hpha_TRINITY_DN15389_c2_g7::TRINITY_DN15389_c2_g7_i1::g.87594::m.87594